MQERMRFAALQRLLRSGGASVRRVCLAWGGVGQAADVRRSRLRWPAGGARQRLRRRLRDTASPVDGFSSTVTVPAPRGSARRPRRDGRTDTVPVAPTRSAPPARSLTTIWPSRSNATRSASTEKDRRRVRGARGDVADRRAGGERVADDPPVDPGGLPRGQHRDHLGSCGVGARETRCRPGDRWRAPGRMCRSRPAPPVDHLATERHGSRRAAGDRRLHERTAGRDPRRRHAVAGDAREPAVCRELTRRRAGVRIHRADGRAALEDDRSTRSRSLPHGQQGSHRGEDRNQRTDTARDHVQPCILGV
jgi:hypothetical protein